MEVLIVIGQYIAIPFVSAVLGSLFTGVLLWQWQREKEKRYKLFEEAIEFLHEQLVYEIAQKSRKEADLRPGDATKEIFIKSRKYTYLIEAYFSPAASEEYKNTVLKMMELGVDEKVFDYIDKTAKILIQELKVRRFSSRKPEKNVLLKVLSQNKS